MFSVSKRYPHSCPILHTCSKIQSCIDFLVQSGCIDALIKTSPLKYQQYYKEESNLFSLSLSTFHQVRGLITIYSYHHYVCFWIPRELITFRVYVKGEKTLSIKANNRINIHLLHRHRNQLKYAGNTLCHIGFRLKRKRDS